MGIFLQLTDHVYLVGSGELALSHYLDCSVYLVGSDREFALVDAGAGRQPDQLMDNIRTALGDPPPLRYLLLTHCHGDHAGGVHHLKQAWPLQVVASQFELTMLEHGSDDEIGLTQAKFSGTYPTDYTFTHAHGDIAISHGQTIRVGSLTITALITPGHTAGSTCYLVDDQGRRLLFSGDTIFWGGAISLLNTPGSEVSDYRRGVQALRDLGVDCLFPGHGLWALRHGQAHIDKLLHYFRGSRLPPMPPPRERIVY